jgi:hypothetical protein
MQELPELDAYAFKDLLDHLMTHKTGINRYRTKVGDGRSQCYGMVRKRSQAPDLSRQSWMDPRLHHLLMKFALVNVPIPFTSVQVNDSYLCAPHKDVHNAGNSYIVGFGPYTGGELVLKNPTDTEYNIRHRPILFDGSQIEHWTKDFVGRRFTIVFHTLVSPAKFPMTKTLDNYEAVVVDGVWCIAWRQDGLPTTYLSKKNGLPHPLKGRKKKLEAPPPLVQDPSLTPAQNLMLLAKNSDASE